MLKEPIAAKKKIYGHPKMYFDKPFQILIISIAHTSQTFRPTLIYIYPA